MEVNYVQMRELKVGRYVVIDGEPCKIVEIETSAPGKHGAAKMRVVGIGLFDNQKRTLLKSADAEVEIPIINKVNAQVVSVQENSVQVMDLNTYQIYEVPIKEEEKENLKPGTNVELIECLGKKAIFRILG
ncbi:MAG: translation initiation factor IF-5A [Candidatus Micrarchaeales archaeon]